jgi:hypothetical protein
MSILNARIGRTLPSPSLKLIRHQVVRPAARRATHPRRTGSPYVGALLVAAAFVLLGSSIFPRPAADPISCRAESAR